MGNYDNPFDPSPNDSYWRERQRMAAAADRWKQEVRTRELEYIRQKFLDDANFATNPPQVRALLPKVAKVKKDRRLLLCGP